MNRNVAEAAGGTRQIASALSGLADGTQQTDDRVADARRAAAEPARMSGELQDAVRRFSVQAEDLRGRVRIVTRSSCGPRHRRVAGGTVAGDRSGRGGRVPRRHRPLRRTP